MSFIFFKLSRFLDVEKVPHNFQKFYKFQNFFRLKNVKVLKKPIEIRWPTLSTTTVGFEFSETDQKLIKYPEKKIVCSDIVGYCNTTSGQYLQLCSNMVKRAR